MNNWKELVEKQIEDKDTLASRKISKTITGDQLEVSNTRNGQIKTLKQLIQVAEIDQDIWEIERYKANVWNSYSSVNGLQDLHQITAHCKRKPVNRQDFHKLIEDIVAESRNKVVIPKNKIVKNGRLIEIAIPDLHLGKLCWEKETGQNYDVKIAVSEYKKALLDLLSRVNDTEEAWLVIGNDFFNVDNSLNQTTGGTPQDEDGRNKKTFEIGVQLIVWATEVIKKKAGRVKIIVVAGNHDEERAFFLGTTLNAWYRKDPSVVVDNDPKPHKFFVWGDTLIGMSHGDRISKQNLAALLPNIARPEWGKTKHAELHLGHLHHNLVIELAGVTLRWLSSLTTPDKWHVKGGYVTAERGAQIFEYNKKGLLTIHNYNP